MNTVNLIGRWTKDLELRFTNTGTAVATGTLAVDEGYGEKKTTNFIPVVIWQKAAEKVAEYTKKGSKVAVEGRLSTRSYKNKEDKTVFVMEVTANQVHFLDSKQKDSNAYNHIGAQFKDPFVDAGQPINISDDELPF